MTGSRVIPAQLKTLIESRSASLTVLLKIVPVTPGAVTIAMTRWDQDYTYDDGEEELTYSAITGLTTANMQASSTMSVGNSEATSLVAASSSSELDAEDVRAGYYDNALYTFMVMAPEFPEYGHWIPPNGHGVVGRQTIDERGLSVTFELTDLTKLLKQAVVENWSRECRAIYGSQPIGTGGGVIEQKYPCGKDVSTLWTGTQTVTSVGAENTRTFTASGLGAAADAYNPGVLKWQTGDNAGRTFEVESQSGSGVITQRFPVPFPVQIGDTFIIRPDCTYNPEGAHGCKANFSDVSPVEWKLHYRGEWQTPVADGDALTTPGTQM